MKFSQLKSHILTCEASVKDALDAINSLSGGKMILFITDCEERVLGALSGGDIRRALLRGVGINDNVQLAMNRNFTALDADSNPAEVVTEGKRRHLHLIPVIRKGELVDIIDID